MGARDLNAQVFDPQPCGLCADQGVRASAVAVISMPWGQAAFVCEAHRAKHADRAKLWPAKDAIRSMLRGGQ